MLRNIATTHGDSKTRFYSIWRGMVARCSKNGTEEYYGRGIKVCARWKKYENFKDDMLSTYSDELTIDRIDNEKGYNKTNCRWTTREVQQNNTRRCRKVTYKGKTMNIQQWAVATGLHRNTLDYRIAKWGICEKTFKQEAKDRIALIALYETSKIHQTF